MSPGNTEANNLPLACRALRAFVLSNYVWWYISTPIILSNIELSSSCCIATVAGTQLIIAGKPTESIPVAQVAAVSKVNAATSNSNTIIL